MAELIPVLNKNDIDTLVASIARKISSDYQDHDLVLIGVLKGAFVFISDLVRHLSIPVIIDFIRVLSYGSGVSSSRNIQLTKDIEIDIKNKDVLIIEDIVDTGLTLKYLIDYLKTYHPKTIRVCTLIDKHERREVNVEIDYICHSVAEGFLVGYGLDYDEDYRYLPEVYHLQL
ncbi:MAG: hypoxanthine phosphoribosyltransferase [Deltaproteobacteria bacterium]|jgi:hypoxanthine phosphoribosyltransferase|nr:hypoxanthine phosphoribosyltransferase [Deltaproteobacteria bacterium]